MEPDDATDTSSRPPRAPAVHRGKVELRVLGTTSTLQEHIRKQAEEDLGIRLRFIVDDSLAVQRAGVMHQLVVYHFKTKDALWRAVITSILGDNIEQFTAWRKRLKADSPSQALRTMVRQFVLFTARRPEFHRIATFEGRADNARIRWLLETYVRPYFEFSTGLIREAQAVGAARPGDPGQLHYAVIGLVTTSFIFAHEYRAMTGLEPFDPLEIEKVAELAWDFLAVREPAR